MTGQKKQAVLKRFYFRNFTIMVVIPLLVVFIGAFSVVSYLIRQTAVETIDAFQDSVVSALENDIRTASLQLSHFVYTNDGEFPAMAAGIVIIMLPTILIYVFFQRYILAGVAAGAVKE